MLNVYRLSYIRNRKLLIMTWPTAIHESPIQALNIPFSVFLSSLPFDKDIVKPAVSFNYSMESDEFSGIPDLTISFESPRTAREEIPFIAEIAFSQNPSELLEKLKAEVASHPEIVMVMMVTILEEPPYRAPSDRSNTWETLRQSPSLTPFDFAPSDDEERQANLRVVVGDHTWCCLTSIEYRLWIRREGPIDLSRNDSDCKAHGVRCRF